MVGLIVGKWQQPPGVKTLFCHSSISPARGGTDFFITDRVWISSVRTLDFPEISFGFVELNFWICRPACFERIQGRVGARPSMDCEEEEEATVASRNLFPTFAKSSMTGIVVGP